MDTKPKTYSSEKNRKIAVTMAATRLRRANQVPVTVHLKVRYGKRNNMPYVQCQFFDFVFVEAKRLKNFLLSLSDNGDITDDNISEYVSDLRNIVMDSSLDEEDEFDVFKADQKDFKTVMYYTKGVNDKDTEYIPYQL